MWVEVSKSAKWQATMSRSGGEDSEKAELDSKSPPLRVRIEDYLDSMAQGNPISYIIANPKTILIVPASIFTVL